MARRLLVVLVGDISQFIWKKEAMSGIRRTVAGVGKVCECVIQYALFSLHESL